MLQLHLRHSHLRHIQTDGNLQKLYWSYAITGLATAIVSVLGPIYLYKIGYSIEWILWYLLLTALIKLPLLYVAFKCIARWGSYRAMAVGIFFLILSYLSIGTIEVFDWPIFILAATKALANAFYYPAFRVSFANDCDKTKAGTQISALHSIMLGLGLIAPLAGGLIATGWGVSAVYYVGALMFATSSMVLLSARRGTENLSFNLTNIPYGKAKNDYISNGFYSTSGLADLLAWPLLLSFIVPSYAGIGLIGSLFVLLSLGVSLLVGKLEDKRGERVFTVTGSILGVFHSGLRVLVSSITHLVGLSLVGAISSALLASSYESRYYKNVDRKHSLEYLFMMEVANATPWVVYFPIMIILSMIIDVKLLLYVGVLLIAPAVLGTMLIRFSTTPPQSSQAQA